MSTKKIKIKNGRIIVNSDIVTGRTLVLTDGKVSAISDSEEPDDEYDEVIDARGMYISPGFIDIHVHGGGGFDFMDGTVESFLGVAKTHARYGTTSLVPTTLTAGKEELISTLQTYTTANEKNTNGAQFLGMHIEGPYFALAQRGAQDARYIRDPDPVEYMEILGASNDIIRWSVAPERKGAMEFGRVLRDRGVLPSIAHTDALYTDVVEAFDNGYTLVTHLYSAMTGVTRKNAFRYGGVVESAFVIDEMDVEIIADGRHLPAELLKLVYKIKGPERTALITDAMRAAAMPPGESILGSLHDGMRVLVEDGVAKLPDRTAFAGSVATFDRLIRTMVDLAEIPLLDVITMATRTPARIMGVGDRKGSIEVGKDADIVVFDENINVHTTLVGGRIVFSKNNMLIQSENS